MWNKIQSLYTLIVIKLLVNKYKYIINETIHKITINGNLVNIYISTENDSNLLFCHVIYGCCKFFNIVVNYDVITNYINKYTYCIYDIQCKNNIEVELFDNKTHLSVGFSNDKLEYIKELCKLNDCYYKII